MNNRLNRVRAIERNLKTSRGMTEVTILGVFPTGHNDYATLPHDAVEFHRTKNETVEAFKARVRREAERVGAKHIVFGGAPKS